MVQSYSVSVTAVCRGEPGLCHCVMCDPLEWWSGGQCMKKEVQGRWGRVATRCAAIAERDEVSRRECNRACVFKMRASKRVAREKARDERERRFRVVLRHLVTR